ncbi:unnamed protein product [Rhizophagus irregularis]|nr:unnamed protein product [Rhizophagus irregularis]
MAHLAKYTNIINLEEVAERNINGKSFLEILRIALQKVELIRPTAIQGYVESCTGVKNKTQLTYLLFTLAAVANEYEVSLKNYIDKTIQEQVVQFESIELTNDTPVSTLVQPMETENFENVEHQLMDVELDD